MSYIKIFFDDKSLSNLAGYDFGKSVYDEQVEEKELLKRKYIGKAGMK